MTDRIERSAEWVYQGLWKVLSDGFRVPQEPPSLPVSPDDFCLSFHPSRRYLAYLKLFFWIGLFAIDLVILFAWIAITVASPIAGMILAVPMLLVAVVPDIVAYVAIHLRYDTMWYVLTDRSLRVRRGIWVIIEHTITFENIQNVALQRGPVQQYFGIAALVVETAGSSEGQGENPFAVGNKAVLEGIDNAEEIRDMIMERVKASRSTGLGDDKPSTSSIGFSDQHVNLLRQIRDEVRAMS